MDRNQLAIEVDGSSVSALWQHSSSATAALTLAHGAGAGMNHRFMAAVANGLAERGVATLRFQFPYMEAGRSSPGKPEPAIAAVRAAAAKALELAPDLPLFAGGKSYGGRMTSTAESERHLDGVRGLVFFGFPLHPPGKPSRDRAAHLEAIELPLLFLQGTRDTFADNALIEGVCSDLGRSARLIRFDQADHSFHVPKASGKTDAVVMSELLDACAAWIGETAGKSR